jgi:hypothetical protein
MQGLRRVACHGNCFVARKGIENPAKDAYRK